MTSTPSVLTPDTDDIGHRQNQKVFDVYNVYRLVLSLILFVSFYFRDFNSTVGSIDQDLFLQVVAVYMIFNAAIFFRIFLPRNRALETSQYVSVILIDIIFLVVISYTCGGVSSGMANLLIVPVAAGSLLFRSRITYFFAAVASILAIYSEVYIYLIIDEGNVFFVQAGLLGFTLFAVSGSLQYLGGRIRQNELLARQQAENIESLQEMNNQIIQRMQTGILVVNERGQILNINDAAKRFLGSPDSEMGEITLPGTIADQLQEWLADNHARQQPFRLEGSSRDLQANFAYLNPGSGPVSNILILLEDFSLLTSRAQQLKLMSLGRLTASIAHEVRNPLGAISHASQLLNESNHIEDSDQRLLEIIASHSRRVNKIIESILDLSRKRGDDMDQVRVRPWLRQFVTKYANSQATPVDIDIEVEPADIVIQFNPGQLEQVVNNLCENGLRYSEKATGKAHVSVRVGISPEDSNPVMYILDDGNGIPEELMEQIFEPFFTTEQAGTGLGLFICREICDANYARLSYHPEFEGKSCFQINFTSPDSNTPDFRTS